MCRRQKTVVAGLLSPIPAHLRRHQPDRHRSSRARYQGAGEHGGAPSRRRQTPGAPASNTSTSAPTPVPTRRSHPFPGSRGCRPPTPLRRGCGPRDGYLGCHRRTPSPTPDKKPTHTPKPTHIPTNQHPKPHPRHRHPGTPATDTPVPEATHRHPRARHTYRYARAGGTHRAAALILGPETPAHPGSVPTDPPPTDTALRLRPRLSHNPRWGGDTTMKSWQQG